MVVGYMIINAEDLRIRNVKGKTLVTIRYYSAVGYILIFLWLNYGWDVILTNWMGLVRKLIITSVFFNRQSSGTGIWQLERRRMSEFIILLVTSMLLLYVIQSMWCTIPPLVILIQSYSGDHNLIYEHNYYSLYSSLTWLANRINFDLNYVAQ